MCNGFSKSVTEEDTIPFISLGDVGGCNCKRSDGITALRRATMTAASFFCLVFRRHKHKTTANDRKAKNPKPLENETGSIFPSSGTTTLLIAFISSDVNVELLDDGLGVSEYIGVGVDEGEVMVVV